MAKQEIGAVVIGRIPLSQKFRAEIAEARLAAANVGRICFAQRRTGTQMSRLPRSGFFLSRRAKPRRQATWRTGGREPASSARKTVVSGKRVSDSVVLGGRHYIHTKDKS